MMDLTFPTEFLTLMLDRNIGKLEKLYLIIIVKFFLYILVLIVSKYLLSGLELSAMQS